ncbi:MAG: SusE domain-containing protein [Saprospiraceae bacterium]
MKKILTLALAAALFLGACTEKDKEPVLAPGAAPSITSPSGGTSFVLTEGTAADIFSTFTWTAADYGFDAGVNYTLELDKAGNNFADAVTVGSVNALTLTGITQEKINTILISKDLPGDEESDIEFRVVAKLSSDATLPLLISQPITLKIKPFEVVIIYPFLHVPGSYQVPDDWQPADSSTVIYSARSDGKYEGYIYITIPNAKYKYTNGPAWTVNYGDNGNDGSLESSGADIPLTEAGAYKLNVDLNALTHTYAKTDWGLVGSATGSWDVDQDMVYDPATNKWSITLDLVAGDIKFRANDAWDINFGDTGANKKLEYGGDNIAVAEAGNYTIELNLGAAVYTYKITRN